MTKPQHLEGKELIEAVAKAQGWHVVAVETDEGMTLEEHWQAPSQFNTLDTMGKISCYNPLKDDSQFLQILEGNLSVIFAILDEWLTIQDHQLESGAIAYGSQWYEVVEIQDVDWRTWCLRAFVASKQESD